MSRARGACAEMERQSPFGLEGAGTMVVDLQELGQRMLADFDDRTPGRRLAEPLDLTTVQAYALQAEIARLREERGEKVIGYKVGCTSRAIQTQLGVNEPIFGRLFDTGCFRSGSRLSCARFANLAVEGELAVRLSKDLSGESLSADECREAFDEMLPVIELHHYVLPAVWPRGQWLIASGGMHAGFVLAERQTHGSGQPTCARSLSVRINDVVVGSVTDFASLPSPVESLRWLAARLEQFGLQLRKGQVILTGSPLNLFPISAASRIVVEAPPLGASRAEIDP
jgi:2-keto-4-pentenoate hydratase